MLCVCYRYRNIKPEFPDFLCLLSLLSRFVKHDTVQLTAKFTALMYLLDKLFTRRTSLSLPNLPMFSLLFLLTERESTGKTVWGESTHKSFHLEFQLNVEHNCLFCPALHTLLSLWCLYDFGWVSS